MAWNKPKREYKCPRCGIPAEIMWEDRLICDECDVSFFPPMETINDKEGRI